MMVRIFIVSLKILVDSQEFLYWCDFKFDIHNLRIKRIGSNKIDNNPYPYWFVVGVFLILMSIKVTYQ